MLLTKQHNGDKNKRAEKSIGRDEECRKGAVYVLAAAMEVWMEVDFKHAGIQVQEFTVEKVNGLSMWDAG